MKHALRRVVAGFVTVIFLSALKVFAQGTAFTYQGRLMTNGQPADGSYDFQFRLYDAPTNGNQVPTIPLSPNVTVSNGLFTTAMDFGSNVFTGAVYWLEIAVQPHNGASFSTLGPRQEILPAPGAIFANNASNLLGTLSATQLTGTVAINALPSSPSFSGSVTAASFSGDGANLTNVNALSVGGIAFSNLWRLDGNNAVGSAFLGTTNNQPLDLRIYGWRGWRLEPNPIDGSHSNMVNVVGGASYNFVAPGAFGGTIGGGGAGYYFGHAYTNSVSADFGTVGGGQHNQVTGANGFVGGGLDNISSDNYSTVGGGEANAAGGIGSTVAGGLVNIIQTNALSSAIAGGFFNLIQTNTPFSDISGGLSNAILISASNSVIGGGVQNTIGGNKGYGTIGGGGFNVVSNLGATIAGGAQNVSIGQFSVVGGGGQNIATAEGATIAGGYINTNTGIYATVAGGNQNLASGKFAAVPGGVENVAKGLASFAAGSFANANHNGAFVWADSQSAIFASTANDQFLVRAQGGAQFLTSGAGLSIDGQPVLTTASPNVALRVGGNTFTNTQTFNSAINLNSSGGFNQSSIGNFTIDAPFNPGGRFIVNTAGNVGIGTGNPSASLHVYSANNPTVMRIQSTGTPGFGRIEFQSNPQGDANEWRPAFIQSLDGGGFTGGLGFYLNGAGSGSKFGTNEVMRLINGSVGIGTSVGLSNLLTVAGDSTFTGVMNFGTVERQNLNLYGTGTYGQWCGIGVQSTGFRLYCRSYGGFSWYQRGTFTNSNTSINDPGPGGIVLMDLDGNGNLNIRGGFGQLSDRNEKEQFEPLNPQVVLDKVVALPLSRWSYKSDPAIRHAGPMAQDFHSAFGLGEDDRHIMTIDAEGVALAAIQGLNQKLEQKETEISELKEKNDSLEKRLAALEAIVRNQK